MKTSSEKLKKGKMLKRLIFCIILLSTGSVSAQDLDISLFDDVPNVGHDAAPLDSLRITPPPAPDIRIPLDTSIHVPPNPVTEEPSIPPLPSIAIDLPGAPPPELPEEIENTAQKPKRPLRDASVFDVSNFELGDTATSVFRKAQKSGFKVLGTQERIPLFYATRYEEKCRKQGIITPDTVSKCIQDYACHEKTRYIAEAKLQRGNEYLTLYFTTNANDNELYKIIYISTFKYSSKF